MVGLPETEGALSLEAAGPALKAIGRADAVVLGPGLGKGDGPRGVRAGDVRAHRRPARDRRGRPQRARGLLPRGPAAAALADRAHPARRRAGPAARRRLQGGRPRAAASTREAAASKARAFVVLKGDDTLVVSPTGTAAISRGQAPGAGDGRHRRRALGHHRRDAGQGPRRRPTPPARASTRTSARARSPPPRTGRRGDRLGRDPRDPRGARRLSRPAGRAAGRLRRDVLGGNGGWAEAAQRRFPSSTRHPGSSVRKASVTGAFRTVDVEVACTEPGAQARSLASLPSRS